MENIEGNSDGTLSPKDKFGNLRIGQLEGPIKGVGVKNLRRLQVIEDDLAKTGFEGGLPLYLALTDKSLRELQRELSVDKVVLARVFLYYQIPRLTHAEATAKVLNKLWTNPEYQAKIKAAGKRSLELLRENPEIQEKRLRHTREAAKRPDVRAKKSEAALLMWANPEHRQVISEKVSASVKKRWEDPEIRGRMIQAIRAAKGLKDPMSEEHRGSVGERIQKITADPNVRAKISATMKAKYEDPVYRQAQAEALKELREDPTVRLKMMASRKKYWEDPASRQRHSEIMKRSFQDPDRKHRYLEAMNRLRLDPEFKQKQLKGVLRALSDEENKQKRLSALQAKWADPEFREKMSRQARETITQLNESTNQLEKAAEGIRRLRADPKSAERFHIPTIQGYRKDIGYFAQSSWEANFARILLYLDREFYTKESFMLSVPDRYKELFTFGVAQYTVDFIVADPRGNLVAYDLIAHPLEEPIGFAKADMFSEQYPEVKLHVIDEELYERLKQEFKPKIDASGRFIGWETARHNLQTDPEQYA